MNMMKTVIVFLSLVLQPTLGGVGSKGSECGETTDCAGDLVCSPSSLTCVEAFTVVFFSDLENHYRGFTDAHSYGFVKNVKDLGQKDLKFDGDFKDSKIDPKMLLHGGDLSRDRWAAEWRARWHDLANAQVTIDEEFEYVWDQTYESGIPTLSTYGNHDWSIFSVPQGANVRTSAPWVKRAENRRCAGEVIDVGDQWHDMGCANACARKDPEIRFFGFPAEKNANNQGACKCYLEANVAAEVTCTEEEEQGMDLYTIDDWFTKAADGRQCDGSTVNVGYRASLRACGLACKAGWLRTPAFSYGTNDFGAEGCDANSENCLCACHMDSSHPGDCDSGEVEDARFRLFKMTDYESASGPPARDINGVNVGLDWDWTKDEQHHDNMMTRDLMRRTFEKSAKLGLKYEAIKHPDGEFGPVVYVAEYQGVQIVMFGTAPFEESYNEDYKGIPAEEQLKLVKEAVKLDMPTLLVSHFPIATWQNIYGNDRYQDFKDFLCSFEHASYLDGHNHARDIHYHTCDNGDKHVDELTAPYRSGKDSGAWALLVSPQDGVLQAKFVPLNERVDGDDRACIPEGQRCLAGTTCEKCCLDVKGHRTYNWWHGLVGHGCGVEPKWGDGTRCLAGTSCNQCKNEYTWWHGLVGHGCGVEPKWGDGTRCLAGTSCNQCRNSYSWWHSVFGHACGEDKDKWADGTRCLAGTSCDMCQNEYTWWHGLVGHGCGVEPKWGDGTRCLAGTTCEQCRNEYTWWHGLGGHGCGVEPKWADGTRCLAGTSCNQCKNSYSWWYNKHGHHCGEDPHKWGDGTRCLAGTSCDNCRNGYEWWESKFGHHCGKEPCWKKGEICGAGTTCNNCCKVPSVPWYQFGIGHCD